MSDKDSILEWLTNNQPTVKSLIHYTSEEAKILLIDEPLFQDEILRQYKNRIKMIVGTEISRQLGLQIDNVLEVLEHPQIQEYLIDDSLRSNVGPA